MSFPHKNNNLNSRKTRSKIIAYVLTVFILIITLSFPWSKNIIFSIGLPFWQFKNYLATLSSESIDVLKSKKTLIDENQNLKMQIRNFEIQSHIFSIIKTENENLKSILNRKNYNPKGIISVILKKPNFSPYDTLVIDIGSSSGISKGDKVFSDDSLTYIGYISEVFDNQSKVTLYSSPGEKVLVLIGKNNVLKEAEGVGGGNFIVELPREFDVKEGDSIIIPSITPNIFGIVEKVNYKEADSFAKIMFKSPVNISELKWVIVVPSVSK